MCKDKPITILLVEDDKEDCELIRNYINTREDVKLIGIVNSPDKALESIRTYMPDAIILDIELNSGKGSGLEILKEMKSIEMDFKPIIIITTNIVSKTVYEYAHENGADMIFHKLKDDYSADLVIRNILLLTEAVSSRKIISNLNHRNTETVGDYRNRISDRINRELDLIGISSHLVGRKYIHDSILYILENDNKENVFLYLAKYYKKGKSTIGRSIQTAIEHAWRKTSVEDLEKYYTTAVNYNTGVPTPTELIYYYVEKIKKSI